ncbi:MAG: exonuclease domain-containing protein [Bacteroidota bacterium]
MNQPLAIVDVETTGTSPVYHRIIEIAILRIERGKIVRQYESLVNPERYISPFIKQITGISNDDVAEAPLFREIADDVLKMLRNTVFVAHNARFDLAFLRREFGNIGKRFQPRSLCTVKLSRKLYPQERRHDLSSIIKRHRLSCANRHRAMGDARVVYQFLSMVQEEAGQERFAEALSGLLRSRTLPPHVDPAAIDDLPQSPGAYIFTAAKGEVLYVGKSRNIRDRVLDHFSAERAVEMCQQISSVEARPTAGELGALLLELHLIKELRPVYNQISRSKKPLCVLWRELSPEGYVRLLSRDGESIDPSEASSILGVFKNRSQANRYIVEAAKKHRLCHKFLGLENSRGSCFGYHLKRCDGACVGEEPPDAYNARVEEAFARRRVRGWPYEGGVIIKEERSPEGEGELFFVDQWCLLSSIRYTAFGSGHFIRGTHTFDYDSYKVIFKYLLDTKNRKNVREASREELAEYLQQMEGGPT